ncbi:KEOPS complex subunit Pcc1 [uncultured Methanobrevibacter sp.]|uniref:KEOPS complex subunit Pcc1 n=1 Tax=uncultured Methanobrevibacter sp. TaxID=253161 RepID=UPI0025E249E1|nr:KEOPS complex subunit Pcc1 [uncultured Methanobrevibacter sp.]
MKVKSKIELEFKTPEDAEIIYKTLEVDNENFLDSKIEGNIITYETDNDSLSTTLATIDDLIACEIISEKITTIKK